MNANRDERARIGTIRFTGCETMMKAVMPALICILVRTVAAGEARLRNDAIEATVRSGMLCALRQRDDGRTELIRDRPEHQRLAFDPFGENADCDLEKC